MKNEEVFLLERMLGHSLSYHSGKIFIKGAMFCHESSFQNQLKTHGDMCCARMEYLHASLRPFYALRVFLLSGFTGEVKLDGN